MQANLHALVALLHTPSCLCQKLDQDEFAASPTSCMLAEATKCVWLVHFMSARVSGCSSPVGSNPVLPSSSGSGKSRFKSTSPLHDEHDGQVKQLATGGFMVPMDHEYTYLHVCGELVHPCSSDATVATNEVLSKQEVFTRIHLQNAVPCAAVTIH